MALRKRDDLRHYWTEDEYFRLESESDERHEYADGVIYDMAAADASASENHLEITFNITGVFYAQTRGAGRTGCHIYGSDRRVQAFAPSKLRVASRHIGKKLPRIAYYMPDISALCGEPELRIERGVPVLLNPALIIGVLSPSTEVQDRGEKGEDYRSNSSVQEYLLIAQDRMHITRYTRDPAGQVADGGVYRCECRHRTDQHRLYADAGANLSGSRTSTRLSLCFPSISPPSNSRSPRAGFANSSTRTTISGATTTPRGRSSPNTGQWKPPPAGG